MVGFPMDFLNDVLIGCLLECAIYFLYRFWKTRKAKKQEGTEAKPE